MGKTKSWLKAEFEMQDLGEPSYCLGMEIMSFLYLTSSYMR